MWTCGHLTLLLLAVHSCFSSTSQILPGLKIQVSQTGLNYGLEVATKFLVKMVDDLHVPDVSGSQKVPLLGNVTYSISKITVDKLTKPSAAITPIQNVGIQFIMSDADLALSGHIVSKLGVGGNIDSPFKVSVTGISASLTVQLTRTSNGKPTLQVVNCTSSVSNLSLDVKNFSWIGLLLKSPIKNLLPDKICNSVIQFIKVDGAKEIESFETIMKLADYVVDYTLVEDPVFESNYVETAHKGEVRYYNNSTSAPFSAPVLSTSPPTRMAAAYISEYVPNTLGYVLHQRGLLKYHLSKSSLKGSEAKFLATTCAGDLTDICAGTLIPPLAVAYPDSYIELDLTSTEAPAAKISPSGITLTGKGTVHVSVRQPDNTLKKILVLNLNATVVFTAEISGKHVIVNVIEVIPEVNIEQSEIGLIDEAQLDSLISLASGAIVPYVNKIANKGLPIPDIKYVDFVDPLIELVEGALLVSTSVKYNP